MTLGELLLEHRHAIVQAWLDDVLATYSEDACKVFKKQKDPFANPVGHALRVATREIFEALLDEAEPSRIREVLHPVIKIRAVQEFSASQAVGFIFRLKEAIRTTLGKAMAEPRLASEWAKIEGQIDQVALAAFDVFVECRQQLYELRVNEVKRNVSWVMEKMSQRDSDSGLTRADTG